MDKFYYDEPGVRLNFCFGLKRALDLCGEENFVNCILPLIPKMQEDVKWRVRAAVLNQIPLFTKLHASDNMAEEDFLKMFEIALKDPISEVREEAISYVTGLVHRLTPNWVISKFLKMIKDKFKSDAVKYSLRLIPIRIAQRLAIFAAKEHPRMQRLQKIAVEMVVESSTDPIVNVRLECANSLILIMKNGRASEFEKEIRAVLEGFKADVDADVQYLALRGLSYLDSL